MELPGTSLNSVSEIFLEHDENSRMTGSLLCERQRVKTKVDELKMKDSERRSNRAIKRGPETLTFNFISGNIQLIGWHHSRVMSKAAPAIRQTSCNGMVEVLERLKTSGWYWGAIDSLEAMKILQYTARGTFLLRDSSDSRHLFTLSVRTARGTTSIRVLFKRGRFTLDNLETDVKRTPNFDCILKLVCYYVHVSNNQDGRHLYAKRNTDEKEDETLLVLRKPLFQGVPSLKHLCRRVVNTSQPFRNSKHVQIPRPIESYLLKYPYPI